MLRIILLLVVACLAVAGCGTSTIVPPEFDGNRAYGYLVDQVEFGPRVPGSDSWTECRGYYYRHFEELGLQVDSQVFGFYDPYSKQDLPLVNVIARFRGGEDDELPVLLVAHWDTRPRTDFHSDTTKIDQPIQGANDGASGVAVLMELANMLAERPPNTNIDILLDDGEDWGKVGDSDYYLMGCKHFAAADGGIRGKYRFGIVVDMVGDKDQRILREELSETYFPELNDLIWRTAAELGVETFVDSVCEGILDDHIAISAAGVPTVDIIDFEYPFWHTENDTPDKCSAEALKNVGTVLAHILYDRSIWPKM